MNKGPSRALEAMAIKWLLDHRHLYGPSPIFECCEGQHTKDKDKLHQKHGGICERDFLQLARESLWWKHVAIISGYSLAKINAPWLYKKDLLLRDGTILKDWPDEGRRVEVTSLTQVELHYDKATERCRIRSLRVV